MFKGSNFIFWSTLNCTTVHSNALDCTTACNLLSPVTGPDFSTPTYSTTLHYTALHYTKLHCSEMYFGSAHNCTAQHCTAYNWIAAPLPARLAVCRCLPFIQKHTKLYGLVYNICIRTRRGTSGQI